MRGKYSGVTTPRYQRNKPSCLTSRKSSSFFSFYTLPSPELFTRTSPVARQALELSGDVVTLVGDSATIDWTPRRERES